MGAFKIAVDNKLPVCPITIIGLRHILRGDEKLLQPKGIKVIAAEPLNSKGENWQSISDLAQKTHDVIAKNCGEPILNLTTASIKPE